MKRKLPASGEPARGREPAGEGAPKSLAPKDTAPKKDAAPKKDVALKSVASKSVGAKGAAPDIIAPEIIESARRALETDRIKPAVKCSVCGADATPNAAEQLCWVCRRLKISAWRDVEQQMPAQE